MNFNLYMVLGLVWAGYSFGVSPEVEPSIHSLLLNLFAWPVFFGAEVSGLVNEQYNFKEAIK